jgi:hypothetical protein
VFSTVLFHRENCLFLAFLPIGGEKKRSHSTELNVLVSVTVDDVRDVINISLADVPDAKILKMLKRAEVTLELELGKEIDCQNCTDAEKECITVLAAIYLICYLTGGSAVGLSFSVGDQNVSVLSNAPPIDVLRIELERMLDRLKGTYVGRV